MAIINEPSHLPFSQKHPRLYISTSTVGPRLPDRPSPLKHLSMRRGSDGDMQLILRRRSSAASSKSARQAMAHALANVASGVECPGGGVKALPESYRKRARAQYSRARKQLLVASITCSLLHRMEQNRSAPNPTQPTEQFPNSLFIDDDDCLEGEYFDSESDSDEAASLNSDSEGLSTTSFSPHDRSHLCASSFLDMSVELLPPSFAPSAESGNDHARNDLGCHPLIISQAPKPATEPETLSANDQCTRSSIRQERSAALKTLLSRRSLTGSTVVSPKSETGHALPSIPSSLPLTVPCACTGIDLCTQRACNSLCSPPDSTLSDIPHNLPAINANNFLSMPNVPRVEEVHLSSPTSIDTTVSPSGISLIIHSPSDTKKTDDESVTLNNAEMGVPFSTKYPDAATERANPSKVSRPILRINTSLKDPPTVQSNYLGFDNEGTTFRTTRSPSMPQLTDLPRPKVFQQRMRSRSSPTMYMGRRKKGPPPPLDLQGLTERFTNDSGKEDEAHVTQRRHRAMSLIETLSLRVSAARAFDSHNSTPHTNTADNFLPIHQLYGVPNMPEVHPLVSSFTTLNCNEEKLEHKLLPPSPSPICAANLYSFSGPLLVLNANTLEWSHKRIIFNGEMLTCMDLEHVTEWQMKISASTQLKLVNNDPQQLYQHGSGTGCQLAFNVCTTELDVICRAATVTELHNWMYVLSKARDSFISSPMESAPTSLTKWTGHNVRDLAKILNKFADMMDSNPSLQPESIASSIPATLLELVKLASNSTSQPAGL